MSITTTVLLMFPRPLPEGVVGAEPEVATRTLLIITLTKITMTTMATITMVTAAATTSPTTATTTSRCGASADRGADPEEDAGRGLRGAGAGFPSMVEEEAAPDRPEEAERGGEEAGFEGYVAAVGM